MSYCRALSQKALLHHDLDGELGQRLFLCSKCCFRLCFSLGIKQQTWLQVQRHAGFTLQLYMEAMKEESQFQHSGIAQSYSRFRKICLSICLRVICCMQLSGVFLVEADFQSQFFRPSATVSRIGLLESCLHCRCHWCGGPPPPPPAGWLTPPGWLPPKVAHDEAGSLMESCLCWCGGPPPMWRMVGALGLYAD